jgi:methyl-accepting chemotaxis protein
VRSHDTGGSGVLGYTVLRRPRAEQERRPRRRGLRYRYRLTAAMVAVSVPLMAALAVALTASASSGLSKSAERRGESVARAITLRAEDWLAERQATLATIAGSAGGDLANPDIRAEMTNSDESSDDVVLMELVDLSGRVRASSRTGVTIDPAGETWFRTAVAGRPVITSLVGTGSGIRWVIARPVLGAGDRPVGVVVADLNPAVLVRLFDPELDQGGKIVVSDAQHRLIYDTSIGEVADGAALLAAGALQTTVDNLATQQATSTGEPGTARYADRAGRDVIGGYDILDKVADYDVTALNWVVSVEDPAAAVLAPVSDQRRYATLAVVLGALLSIGAALVFGTREARKLRGLADHTSSAGWR